MNTARFSVSPCVALCTPLPPVVAPKGQEKGNVPKVSNPDGAARLGNGAHDVRRRPRATDKRSRLQVAAHHIKNGTVPFPRHGCEQLLAQIFNLAVEARDGLTKLVNAAS
jgi:hypothetical protein